MKTITARLLAHTAVPEHEPHLWVVRWRPGRWTWLVITPDGWVDHDSHPTHGEALAVGLAALDAARVPR